MHSDEWIEKELRYQRDLLYRVLALLTEQGHEIEEIEQDVHPKLSFIKLAIGGDMPVGPVTLNVGDKKTATVLGFDQNGAAIAIDFTANPVTWADDNETSVSQSPQPDGSDPLTALAAGVANISATCSGFSDSESVTVVAAAPVVVVAASLIVVVRFPAYTAPRSPFSSPDRWTKSASTSQPPARAPHSWPA